MMPQPDGIVVPIPIIDPKASKKTLGVLVNMTGEEEAYLTVGNKMGAYVRGHPLPIFPKYISQKLWPAARAA